MAKRKRKVYMNKAANKGGKAANRTIANSEGAPEDTISVISVSTVTLKHSRALIRSVVDYPAVQLYDTSTNGKFIYHVSNSGNLKLTDPNRTAVVPTLRQLEYIVDNMVKTNVLELKWANGSSEFYDYSGVIRLREILMCKVVKDVMEKGNRFLFDCGIPESQSFQTPVSQGSLEVFWTMVDQDAPGGRVTLNGRSITSASLCSLMSLEASVNEEVIDQISQILNENSKLHHTVVVSSKAINENISLFVCRIKHLFGESLVNVNILIYTNVFDESHSISEKQHHLLMHQHFVFGIYSLEEDKVLYVDTLAKPIPKFFMTCFVKLSKELGKEAIYFGSCHEEKASLGHSFCRDDCLYPYQSCATLGGIAVIIGMCIFTLDRQMFQVLTGQFTCEESAVRVSYLRDMSLHSHFLRLVIINWIINGVIELSQIYKKANMQRCYQGLQLKTRVSSRELEFGVGEELKHPTLTIKTESSPSKSYSDLDHVVNNFGKAHNENPSSVLVRPINKRFAGDKTEVDKTKAGAVNLGEASSGRSSILNISLGTKRKKSLSQGFDNASDLQHVTYVKTCDGQLSISLDEVGHLLASHPGISFKKKECAYCIECTLATGVKRYKFFKCSPDKGKDDQSVLREIQSFFTIDQFLEWLEDDTSPKSKICDKTLRHNSSRSPVKNRKREDDFDPEITIELNEGLSSHFECKVQKTVDNKADTTKNASRPMRSGKSPVSAREELPVDNHRLPSPSKGDVPNGPKAHKMSTANMIRVGCKHGRIPVYFGEVQHLLIGRPTLVFRKNKCYYSLECTFYNGITGYKNFRCNKARGRDDLDALKFINEFLKVENFTPWVKENLKLKSKNKGKRDNKSKCLKKSKKVASRDLEGRKVLQPEGEDIVVIGNDNSSKVMEEDTVQICMEISDTGVVDKYVTSHPDDFETDIHNNPATLSFERIKEFIVGKPKVHFRRAKNMYRVECLLWNGNKVHRNFPCTTSTKAETLEEIQSFLRSDKAVNWVQNYDESWIFQYEVKAGIETRNCLDKIPFDITKHFIYDKKIVKPEYSKETCWVSVTENTKWGKTHRYDETYRIIGSTARCDPNTVVAYVYLSCASKTNECRSACGALLTSLTCQDNVCDNCGVSLDTGRECSHCKTTTSSQWYYKGEPRELCATCYTYRQRKGCDRPVEFKVKGSRNPRKIHHEHLQCQWRMKLEMKLNSLNTWSVYESSENINYHISLPVQENKKPALGIRDMWDKLRVSRKATSLQIHTIESKSVTTTASKEELSSQITHPLSQIKARCELVDKHHSGKRATDEHYQTILNEEHPMDHDESIPQVPQKDKQAHKKLQLESEANHTRICGICFEEGVNPPFTCSTKRELDAHKNKVHNSYGDLCAICYREIGMVVRFEDSRELMQHLNKHKVKYH
ncbi:uncharacterized protein [Macrobrachium rosenbergii]|uniref:uncharacterized protein n=1 Tax=Macrobrachium rosenbergii TaxID=79674 RepID=UPI0034D554BB